jgi:hypothetical protein
MASTSRYPQQLIAPLTPGFYLRSGIAERLPDQVSWSPGADVPPCGDDGETAASETRVTPVRLRFRVRQSRKPARRRIDGTVPRSPPALRGGGGWPARLARWYHGGIKNSPYFAGLTRCSGLIASMEAGLSSRSCREREGGT